MHVDTLSVLISVIAPVLISGCIWVGFSEMLKHNLIVSPQDLEKKHREILDDIDSKFMSKDMASALQRSIDDTNNKVTSIYEMLIGTRK